MNTLWIRRCVCLAFIVLFSGLTGAANQPSPPAAAEPTPAWINRNTSQGIDQAAKEFLDLLVLDSTQLRLTDLRFRTDLPEVAKLASAGKPAEALALFEHYYFNKLRNPTAFGLSALDVDPYVKGVCGYGDYPGPALQPIPDQERVVAVADDLMKNEMNVEGHLVNIGEPGQINWYLPLASASEITIKKRPKPNMYSGSGFTPLVDAYLITRNPAYLKKWVELMDDWAINSDYIDTIHPCIVPDDANSSSVQYVIQLTRVLAGLAQADQNLEKLIPPQSFARIIHRLLCDYPLLSIAYSRSNTHNWTPSAGLLLIGLLYDEFKLAPVYFRIGRRRNIEDNAVTQNLRDGTENQQDPWYNANYLNVDSALRLLEAREVMPIYKDLPWVKELRTSVPWKQDIQEHLNAHINYFIHLRTPQNEWPIGMRGGDKRPAHGVPPGAFYAVAPDVYQEPENERIVAAIDSPGEGIRPDYTSEWFPYAGYNIVRDGWEKDSGYGALFCSPKPGAYGAYRSRSNNNSFGLEAYGRDLLVSDEAGHYMYLGSPIKVDGQEQFFHAGIYKVPPPAAHKVYQVSAWTEPAPWRWSASDRFNLMEGIYEGPYADANGKPSMAGPYGQDESMQGTLTLDQTIRGIKFQRLVMYLREPKVWIVTDRMISADKHAYSQVWRIPIKPSHFTDFEPDEIHVDQATKSVRTECSAEKQPNLSLYQFSSQPLEYAGQIKELETNNHYMMYGWKNVDVNWTSKGPSQVITLIYARKPGATATADLQNINRLEHDDVSGFEATVPGGTHVQYLAATQSNGTLHLGKIDMRGEALLLTSSGGMALGCQSFSVNGQPAETPAPDFEFSLDNGIPVNLKPIYRPIDPVKVLPERNVFVGEQEVILESRTPGVEIRYTLDGTDPTPRSDLYKGSFKLTHDTIVKARAYRPGVTHNPVQLSGTEATVFTRAEFTKVDLIENVPIKLMKLIQPGLQSRYFEDNWRKLWLAMDDLQPKAQGIAMKMFDLSVIPSENAPIGSAAAPREKYFGIEYTGYLNIPADGVYTVHAPRECVMPDTDPGYELQVYLGNHLVPYANRSEIAGINQWYPATTLHALGTWSVALKKGLQPFKITYVDYRTDAPKQLNVPGLNDYIWSGVTPDLRISGPGMEAQPIPASWLMH